MIYLKNPRRKKRRSRKLYGAAAVAHARKLARGKRRKYATNPKRKKATVARRKKATVRRRRRKLSRFGRARRAVRGRVRGVRRRVRRSGRKLSRALVPMIVQGAKDGAAIVVGRVAAKAIPGFLPFNRMGAMGYASTGLSAIAAGYAATRLLGANIGRMVIAGGLSVVIEDVVKAANIPVISSSLGAYYAAPLPNIGSYPQIAADAQPLQGYGDYADDVLSMY